MSAERVLTGWKAKRVGASITIDGRDESGFPVKVTKVPLITSGDPHPTARGHVNGVGTVDVRLEP